ncbi:MAG: hypothetical protein JRZ95_05370 [Nitrososphaerota archaeon]|nr:hypothetical protein [Nitrososphaerota archaeon]
MVKNVPRTRVHAQQHPKVSTPPKITTPQKKEDLFTVYNQSIEKYFTVAKKTTATYLQSVTDLQEQIIDSWKKSVDSAITLQQEFAHKSKMNVKVPDQTIKVINEMAEQTNKSKELQNKMLFASISAIMENIKAFNDNVKTFSQMNKKLVESCGSQMTLPQISAEAFKPAITEFKKIMRDIQVEHPHKSKRR